MTHKRSSVHFLHVFRVAGAGLLVLAFLVAQFHDWPVLAASQSGQVLSYATSMSRSALLSDTNQQRSQAGLPNLSENARLDQSAQAKAEDMIKRNYWAHVGPDGTQPWQYFSDAGYSYRSAGENLAYGFLTAGQTVDAWMNSPTHRANLLGNYRDVGFGIASGHYQGGKYTVVVAHYGLPSPTVAAATMTSGLSPPVTVGASSTINYLDQLGAGNWSAIMLASLSLCVGAALMFGLTHRKMLGYALETGEHFAVRHPLFDAGLVAMALSLIMLSRIGSIS